MHRKFASDRIRFEGVYLDLIGLPSPEAQRWEGGRTAKAERVDS